YSCFAANRSVDLCKQGGRHLNERDSPQITRRGESCKVPYNAASQGHHTIVSLQTRLAQKLERLSERAQRFVSLTLWHQPNGSGKVCFAKTFDYRLAEESEDSPV